MYFIKVSTFDEWIRKITNQQNRKRLQLLLMRIACIEWAASQYMIMYLKKTMSTLIRFENYANNGMTAQRDPYRNVGWILWIYLFGGFCCRRYCGNSISLLYFFIIIQWNAVRNFMHFGSVWLISVVLICSIYTINRHFNRHIHNTYICRHSARTAHHTSIIPILCHFKFYYWHFRGDIFST